ncbi:Uncharacterised protein [Shewanella morhuae]|uniref:Group II intron-encoded protein ltrA n=1 Tax=Shewanella morhuae TaxID=365591 RepID=A0A380C7I7_9GAMM|nr:Uncharacterised protein [Shewanella morhuae]
MSNLSIPTTSPDDYYQQRIDLQPAFNSDLFQQLLEPENLHRAWRQVKANKGAAGIDGMTIEAFPLWMQQGGWQQCKTQLELGEYQPSAVRRVEIDNPMAVNAN